MKGCNLVFGALLLLAGLALTQKVTFDWNKAERPSGGCPAGTRCVSFRGCLRLVLQVASQAGTTTASALRLHFHHKGHFSAVSVVGRLNRQRCPGRERACCPALYLVSRIDLLEVVDVTGSVTAPPEETTTAAAVTTTRDDWIAKFEKKKRKLRNLASLEALCHMPLLNRVFLGEEVKAGHLPWVVMLRYEENGKQKFSCGGALISDRYIVTAAHCANSKNMKLVSARLGEVNLGSDCDEAADSEYINDIESIFGDLRNQNGTSNSTMACAADPQDVAVEEVFVHPEYRFDFVEGFPNDVALVRLKERVRSSQFVQPVCLRALVKDLPLKEEEEGQLTVAGWGMTDMEGGPRTENLQQAIVMRVPRHICRDEHKVMVRDKCQKCAGDLTGNACMGDSGGPLVLKVKGRMPMLTGVVSFGSFDCGALATPTVFTELSCYVDWILETIKD